MQAAVSSPEEIIQNQYKEKLIELAKQDSYTISLQDLESGERIQDPSSKSRKKHYIVFYKDWVEKEYKRHKITKADYEKSKELGAQYEEELDTTVDDDLEKKTDRLIELYQFLASCYLKMPSDEFERADWGYTRAVLDACQYRTNHSLPDLSKALYEYFHFGKASLTPDEYEQIRMYRLWTGKAKTKPWEINGGVVYEEDLNAVLKMEELDISGQNYRAKKESARSRGGQVGADGDVHRKSTRVRER